MENASKTLFLILARITAIIIFVTVSCILYRYPLLPYCFSNADCAKKEGRCTCECLHIHQEPLGLSDIGIVCDYRPWFYREKCECINNRCTKISCEDLGFDYPVCNTPEEVP